MNENIQFEYIESRYVWKLELNKHVEYAIKKFLTVVDTFDHHYTGERMCRVRRDWVDEDGRAMSDDITIVREEDVLNLMEKWKEYNSK